MPEPKRITIFYEGNDDRALIEELQSAGLLSASVNIANRQQQYPGKDGLIYQLAPLVRPVDGVAGNAIALVDLDDLDTDAVRDWFEKEIGRNLPAHDPPIQVAVESTNSPRVIRFKLSNDDRMGKVALIAVGLAEDDALQRDYGIEEFAIDDHILRLVCDSQAYASMPDFKDVDYEIAMNKLNETAALLRNNGIPVRRSKRYLHFLRAVVGFRASSAAFIQRLVKKAIDSEGKDHVRHLLHPLVDDLDEAANCLSE